MYNHEGYYQECNSVQLGKIVRALMNEGLANSWRSGYEKEAIQAIQREANYIEELNPYDECIILKNGMYNLATNTLIPLKFSKNSLTSILSNDGVTGSIT